MADPYLDVVISELMYHAPGSDSQGEYIEVTNRGVETADLTGWRLDDGIRYSFASGTTLAPGARLVLAKDPVTVSIRYGLGGVLGPYDGQLDNGGERVELRNADEGLVCEVDYDDDAPWPTGGDGDGRSIELTNLSVNGNVGRFWQPSSTLLGTPGLANAPGLPSVPVVINEFLANASSGQDDWIELHNAGASIVDLDGFYLTDDPTRPTRARITTSWTVEVYKADGTPAVLGVDITKVTQIPAGGYWVTFQGNWGFGLSKDGEQVHLLDTNVKWVDGYDFGDQPIEGATEGRYPDAGDRWYKFVSPTRGLANALPASRGIVINEIMYHPIGDSVTDPGVEYLELYNTTDQAVSLEGWSLKDAVSYTFGAGASIGAYGYVVIAKNPALVASTYPGREALGPYNGVLSNFDDEIELEDELGNRVDIVHYRQEGLWPVAADGTGPSLELTNYGVDNRLPGVWQASVSNGTPGLVNSRSSANPAASIDDVAHWPLVPTSSQQVTVTARVGAGNLTSVKLYYKRDQDGSFSNKTMVDNGTNGDARSGDGIYTATLSAYASGTIIEFYAQAEATGGNCKYPNLLPPVPGLHNPTCLVIFQDAPVPASNLNIYRFILTDEYDYSLKSNPSDKVHLRDCTFIYGDKVYYNCGIRVRGNTLNPFLDKYSYKVHLAPGYKFRDADSFDLNANRPDLSLLKNKIINRFLDRMGLYEAFIDYSHTRWRNEFAGVHLYTEARNTDFLQRHFPTDYDGNLYKASTCCCTSMHYNDDPGWWEKQTNEEDTSKADLGALRVALSGHCISGGCPRTNRNAPDDCPADPSSRFEANLTPMIDVLNWGLSFAVWGTVAHIDSIWHIHGQNYRVYHRFSDDKFVFIQHDWDNSWWPDPPPYNDPFYTHAGPFSSLFDHIDDWQRHPPYKRAYFYGLYKAIDPVTGKLRPSMVESELRYYHSLIEGPNDVPADPYLEHRLEDNGERPPFFNEGPDWLINAITVRNALLQGYIQAGLDEVLAITTNGGAPITTSNPNVTLAGTAPISAPRLEIDGSEENVHWTTETSWQRGFVLVDYHNTIVVRTLDEENNEIDQVSIEVIYTNGVPEEVDFTTGPLPEQRPYVVAFYDTSPGTNITAWDWDFDDGSDHSYEQNPVHTYARWDSYDVSLTIQADGGPYTRVRTIAFGVPIPGDFDHDGDVDQRDFGFFQTCLSGGGVQVTGSCLNADLDGDSDVDQGDVTDFQACLSGANVTADPSCAD